MKKLLIVICAFFLTFSISGVVHANDTSVTVDCGWGKYFNAQRTLTYLRDDVANGINLNGSFRTDKFKIEADYGMFFFHSTVANWEGDVYQNSWDIKGEYIFVRTNQFWEGISLSYHEDFIQTASWNFHDPITFSGPMAGIEFDYKINDRFGFYGSYDTAITATLTTKNSFLTGPAYINEYNLKLIYMINNHFDLNLGYRFSSHQFLDNGEPAANIYDLFGVGVTYHF